MRTAHVLALLLTATAFGCERPFVPPDATVLAEASPDLSVVLVGEPTLALRLAVSDAGGVEQLTVNGLPAMAAAEPGVFLDTLALDLGLNAIRITVFDDNDNVTEDTLYAAYLPYASEPVRPLLRPRYAHTATSLLDGTVLVAGGFGDKGMALGDAVLVQDEVGDLTYVPTFDDLDTPRGGHTATRLPDGRVLVLGGTTRDGEGFVTRAEVFDPGKRTFSTLAQSGLPLRRYGHTALLLTGGDGRTFIYVYGGFEDADGDVRPTGTLIVFELRGENGQETLVTQTPPGGIGALPVTAEHAWIPLSRHGETRRALTLGPDLAGGSDGAFATRLGFTPSVTFAPFELTTTFLATPTPPLRAFAAAPVTADLVLLSGGDGAAGGSSRELRLYASDIGETFRFPEGLGLGVARARHTATLLPSGRILILGGVDGASLPLAQAEAFGPR